MYPILDRLREKGRQVAEKRKKRNDGRAKGAARTGGTGYGGGRAMGRSSGRAMGRRDAAPAGNFIEGRRAAFEALDAGVPLRRALVADGSAHDKDASQLAKLMARLRAAGVPVERVPAVELDARSSHGAHQGIVLETAPYPYATLQDVIARAGTGAALIVVLDHVTDEGNFGAIVRSAEVVGAAGVVVANKRAAGVGVGAYKTSAGAVMHLPIARVPNLAAALDALKEAGFWVGGASEHARDVAWDTALDGRIALVMGSEGEGISRLVRERCDFLVKLPQRGRTESLNVAQASTALMYEWMRQNRAQLEGEAS